MIRGLVVTVVVVGALAVVADRGTAFAASSYAADHAKDSSDADSAHVTVHGVPFLTQVARGDYRHVVVTEDGIHGADLTIAHLRADAYGAHLPFSDLVHGSTRSVPIDRVTGSAIIGYAALTTGTLRQLGITKGVTFSLKPRDEGDLTATVSGPLGLHLSFDVPAPTISGGKLQLGGVAQRLAPLLPDQVADVLAIPLPSLPYGLHLASARAEDDGVHFTVTGSDVQLSS